MRFYAGWQIDETLLQDPNELASLTKAVPMGGVLHRKSPEAGAPKFLVWAMRDYMDAPLQRIQMIKGWIDEDGETHEKVVDIACADNLAVDAETGRCPDNGARWI